MLTKYHKVGQRPCTYNTEEVSVSDDANTHRISATETQQHYKSLYRNVRPKHAYRGKQSKTFTIDNFLLMIFRYLQ